MDGGDDAVVRCLDAGPPYHSASKDKCINVSHAQRLILLGRSQAYQLPWFLTSPSQTSIHFLNLSSVTVLCSSLRTTDTMHGHTLFFLASLILPIIATPLPAHAIAASKQSVAERRNVLVANVIPAIPKRGSIIEVLPEIQERDPERIIAGGYKREPLGNHDSGSDKRTAEAGTIPHGGSSKRTPKPINNVGGGPEKRTPEPINNVGGGPEKRTPEPINNVGGGPEKRTPEPINNVGGGPEKREQGHVN
ncbi:hypothetical protein GQ44DRAFT_699746 [Phaeosphaeriaceae sp. PMI808]|nr:hypothetical protein GQ44DRAFT_699746 [Phaeosphaeriaceae sp. PMI808]